MNLLWIIPIILILWIGAIPIFIRSERAAYNDGICKHCGGKLRHADNDSQGGMLWVCDDCGTHLWTSWIKGNEGGTDNV